MELEPLPSKSPHHLCFCITTNFWVLSSSFWATFHTLLPRDQPSNRVRPGPHKLKRLTNKNSPIVSLSLSVLCKGSLGSLGGLPSALSCNHYCSLYWRQRPWPRDCWVPGSHVTECLTLGSGASVVGTKFTSLLLTMNAWSILCCHVPKNSS